VKGSVGQDLQGPGTRSAGKRIMGKRDGYRRKQLEFLKCMNVTKEDIRGARRGTQLFRDT